MNKKQQYRENYKGKKKSRQFKYAKGILPLIKNEEQVREQLLKGKQNGQG